MCDNCQKFREHFLNQVQDSPDCEIVKIAISCEIVNICEIVKNCENVKNYEPREES